MKTCTKCGIEKELEEFYKNKACRDGRFGSCKNCVKVQGKEYFEKNKEKVNTRHKKYYYDNIEIEIIRHKKYRDENKEKINKYQKEYYKENKEDKDCKSSIHYQKNKDKGRERSKKYKERKKIQTPQWVTKETVRHFKSLAKLMTEIMGESYEIDHIIPISKGGLHTPFNLQVITSTANREKYVNIITNIGVC